MKKTAKALVRTKLMKQRAIAKTCDFTQRFPRRKSLLRNAMQLMIAYVMSKVFCFRLVLYADMAINTKPMKSDKNMNIKAKERMLT